MKKLVDILQDIELAEVAGDLNTEVSSIEFDSRQVKQGCVFVAVRGTTADGHNFIPKAIEAGARVIVCESYPEHRPKDQLWIRVSNSDIALGQMAHNYYGRPTDSLKLVAVTGTNGKTTITTLLYDLFTGLGFKAGLLSTVENRVAGKVIQATHTTPDAISINRLLAEMVDKGCSYAFMEASSHAIYQNRIAGLNFAGAVFSNITRDHLDYHGTFANYIAAKKKLFDNLTPNAFALVNTDDKNGEVMVQNTRAKVYTYAIKRQADFKAKILEAGLNGLQLQMDGVEVFARMIGSFNAYNLLAVYGTASLLGADKTEVLTVLSNLQGAEGRFDYITGLKSDVVGIVDYAHTPDALEKVLQTIDQIRNGGRVITVFGCGGNRDKGKRPIMTKTACAWSNVVILTSDNPRMESPEAILEEMEQGVTPEMAFKVLSIVDRKQAIKTACQLAQKGDVILVAGKGHEKYQEINGEKFPHDDKAILKEALNVV